MELTGLPLGTLLSVLGVAGAAVVVLYLLKLRRRRVDVAFAPLWARVLVERSSTSLFSQLKRWLSLLVQLVLLALLVAALGDPRTRGATAPGRSLVVLLDASASMEATDVPGGRARAAREAARRLVRGLGAGDRMLLAQMDTEVTALTAMTDDPVTLEAALAAYAPRDTGADLPRALRFALDALRGAPRPEVVVVGDGGYGDARDAMGPVTLQGVALRYVPIGRRGRNAGIAAFAVRRYPLDKSRFEVMTEVQNAGTTPESVELTLSADGAPVEVTRLDLAPGQSQQRFLTNLSSANQSLTARIARADGSHDDLPADDVAWATLPPRRRARVLAVTPGNRYLEAALLLDEYLDVEEVAPADASARLAAGHWDVVIFDGPALPVPHGTGAIYLRSQGPDAPMPSEPALVGAPPHAAILFTQVDTRHPLLRWASDLEEAHVGRIARYTPAPTDHVLARSVVGPLLIAGERHGDRFMALSFDVRESDLPLLVSWPVLLINAVDWFGGEDPAYLSSFRTGETWRVPVPVGVDRAVVDPPTGSPFTVPVLEGRAVFLGVHTGLYRVHAGGADVLVAGNLSDPQESRCAPHPTLTVDGTLATAPRAGRAGVRRELWVYLLAAALAILAVEWVTYHRRVTV